MTETKAAEISVGWWAARCCELDLFQISDEDEAESVRNSILKDEGEFEGAWPTKQAAIAVLAKVEKIYW